MDTIQAVPMNPLDLIYVHSIMFQLLYVHYCEMKGVAISSCFLWKLLALDFTILHTHPLMYSKKAHLPLNVL